MAVAGFYYGDHESQFDGSRYANENCTPTTGANGADNSTGGKIDRTGGQVRALVSRAEETDPHTPGWSLQDLDRAMSRLGVPFDVRSGQGWAALLAALRARQYVALQGVSSAFSNNTCSGAFNGDHCIGVHPARRVVGGLSQHWIDDPICKTGRWEYDYVLRRYATRLSASVRFGVFTHPVPTTVPPPPVKTGYRLHVAARARVHVCNFVNGCVRSETIRVWGPKASVADCFQPVHRAKCSGGTITVARVSDGVFAGRVVHLGPGVTVTKA